MDKKDKRHDGWYTPRTTLSMPRSEMITLCLEPRQAYDGWNERRDGMRFPFDNTKIRPIHCWLTLGDSEWRSKIEGFNKKLKRHLEIRRAMKSRRPGEL